jgi:uncharacterized protein
MQIRKSIDIDALKDFIIEQSDTTKFYLGADSERIKIDGVWYADYITVVVVHKNGNNGCRVFGEVVRERDYDQRKDRPRTRLMNEVMKVADMFLRLQDVLEDREVEIHIDINPDEMHGSSCVINEATGYIRGMCNVVPMVKPESWAATHAADNYLKYGMGG